MRPFRALLLVFGLTASIAATAGGLLVVINARCGIERLNRDEVVNIFMGRHRELASGQTALPIDQPSPLRTLFYRRLVGKEMSAINAYWARLVFSGKVSPPPLAAHAGEVIEWVNQRTCGIGYISEDALNERMRVVLALP